MELIGKRAAGELPTTAEWLRSLVLAHPEYKRDSVVSPKVNFDILTVPPSRLLSLCPQAAWRVLCGGAERWRGVTGRGGGQRCLAVTHGEEEAEELLGGLCPSHHRQLAKRPPPCGTPAQEPPPCGTPEAQG